LRQLHEELPDAMLYFLIGSDALRDVAQWKEPREIFRIATPLIVHRAGEQPPDLPLVESLCTHETRPQVVEMQPVEISSTEIRRRITDRQPLDGLVPTPVLAYIESQNLYR
jgi:nicotinate-nucleotide adenylyltransferase